MPSPAKALILLALPLALAIGGCASSTTDAEADETVRAFEVTNDIETVAAAARGALLENNVEIDDDEAVNAVPAGVPTTRASGDGFVTGTSPGGSTVRVDYMDTEDPTRVSVKIDVADPMDAELRDAVEQSLRDAL